MGLPPEPCECGMLLYSTNTFLKYLINRDFLGDIHYVWCSERFDPRSADRYSSHSLVPPTSSPAAIYHNLKEAVAGKDRHNTKIAGQKKTLRGLAFQFWNQGRFTEEQRNEVTYMVETASFDFWRPLLYVIPRPPVENRLKRVPVDQRASFGVEYIIEELHGHEFDIIEL